MLEGARREEKILAESEMAFLNLVRDCQMLAASFLFGVLDFPSFLCDFIESSPFSVQGSLVSSLDLEVNIASHFEHPKSTFALKFHPNYSEFLVSVPPVPALNITPFRLQDGHSVALLREMLPKKLEMVIFSEHGGFCLETASSFTFAFNLADSTGHQLDLDSRFISIYFAKHLHADKAMQTTLADMIRFPELYTTVWKNSELTFEQLHRVTQMLFEADVEVLGRANLVICPDVSLWFCSYLHSKWGFYLPKISWIVYTNTAPLLNIPGGSATPDIWKAINLLLHTKSVLVGSPNELTIAQVCWQFGVPVEAVPLVHTTGKYIHARWASREGQGLLFWRCVLERCHNVRDIVSALAIANGYLNFPLMDFLDSSSGSEFRHQMFLDYTRSFERFRLVRQPLSFEEIAQSYFGVVLFPWEPFMLALSDLMAVEVPLIWIPGDPFIHRFIWTGSFPYGGILAPESVRERAPWLKGSCGHFLWANGSQRGGCEPLEGLPFDPFSFMLAGPGTQIYEKHYWLKHLEFDKAEFVIHFSSLIDLLEQTAAADEAFISKQARVVKEAKEARWNQALPFWQHAVLHALRGRALQGDAVDATV